MKVLTIPDEMPTEIKNNNGNSLFRQSTPPLANEVLYSTTLQQSEFANGTSMGVHFFVLYQALIIYAII